MRAMLGVGLVVALAVGTGVAYTRERASHHPVTLATSGLTTAAGSARSPQEPDAAGRAAEEPSEVGADCNTNLK